MRRLLSIVAVFAACVAFGTPLRAQEASSPVQQPPNTESQPVPQAEQRHEPQADKASQAERREKPAAFDNPRFAFHSLDDGYVRLDLQTGEVAMCRPRAFGWACTLAADERHAVVAEVTRLQRENARLKQALLERGIALATGSETAAPEQAAAPPAASRPSPAAPTAAAPTPAPPTEAPRNASPTPSDADIDRAMNVMEKFWRRLVAMMATMQRDLQK